MYLQYHLSCAGQDVCVLPSPEQGLTNAYWFQFDKNTILSTPHTISRLDLDKSLEETVSF